MGKSPQARQVGKSPQPKPGEKSPAIFPEETFWEKGVGIGESQPKLGGQLWGNHFPKLGNPVLGAVCESPNLWESIPHFKTPVSSGDSQIPKEFSQPKPFGKTTGEKSQPQAPGKSPNPKTYGKSPSPNPREKSPLPIPPLPPSLSLSLSPPPPE